MSCLPKLEGASIWNCDVYEFYYICLIGKFQAEQTPNIVHVFISNAQIQSEIMHSIHF